jgi:hypothetical protein
VINSPIIECSADAEVHPIQSRAEHLPPDSIEKWGWKYHHLGIPTTEKLPNEQYIPHLKFYVSGFPSSPFGIEWMRFDSDCPLDKLIQTVPHLAFEVTDLDQELAIHNLNVIAKPNSPAPGISVAMIEHNGAPIELIEFQRK